MSPKTAIFISTKQPLNRRTSSTIYDIRDLFTSANNEAGVNREWERESPSLKERERECEREKERDREEGKTKGVATRSNERGRR